MCASTTTIWQGLITLIVQGWGLLSRFPPFRSFPNFSALSKHTLDIEYHVYIWQVSPQLSCGDTCQIWKWFKESNRYFCKIENFANGEINERSFSNPHPRASIYNYTPIKLWMKLFIHAVKFCGHFFNTMSWMNTFVLRKPMYVIAYPRPNLSESMSVKEYHVVITVTS